MAKLSAVLASIAVAAASPWLMAAAAEAQSPEMGAPLANVKGYLPPQAAPDSAALLPPPPALGSAAQALDEETAKASFALRDDKRWWLAAMDADLNFPAAAGHFSCALGAPVNRDDTPRLYATLMRTLVDVRGVVAVAKQKYRRARPFLLDEQPTCSPQDERRLTAQSSYPSTHASIGWAWALALAEALPERSDAILARGLSFGESRIVCNVHWMSDVIAGRDIGAATLAKLHAEPAFRDDLAAAGAELRAARERGLSPQNDCAFEADALAETPLMSP